MKIPGLIFYCLLTLSSNCFAQITAVDISNHGGYIQTTPERELDMLTRVMNSTPYRPATFKESSFNNSFNCVRLALVFKPKPFVLKSSFPKQELIFGAGFLTINSTVTNYTNLYYDSIGLNGRTYNNHISFNLYTHRQQLHSAYYFNSRTFGKRFRAYFGLGAAFGLNTIKTAKRNTRSQLIYVSRLQSDTMFIPDQTNITIEGAYNYSTLSGYMPLGIKYNLDCNFNLFVEFNTGVQFQFGARNGQRWQGISSIGLGIRYKFNDEATEEDLKTSFW